MKRSSSARKASHRSESRRLIARSPDLKRLVADGYRLLFDHPYHVTLAGVSYLNSSQRDSKGKIHMPLDTQGGVVVPPVWHAAYWEGPMPYSAEGTPLEHLFAPWPPGTPPHKRVGRVVTARWNNVLVHVFSRKDKFDSYYDKAKFYANLVCEEAHKVHRTATARPRRR